MSFYLYIRAVQSPFEVGVDGNNRNQRSCNWLAKIRGSSSAVSKEIATRIAAQVGSLTYDVVTPANSDILVGTKGDLPNGDGPFVRVIETAGTPPDTSRDSQTYSTLGIQTFITAMSYDTCASIATAVFDALQSVRNTTLTV